MVEKKKTKTSKKTVKKLPKKETLKKEITKEDEKQTSKKSIQDQGQKLIKNVLILCGVILLLILIWQGIASQVRFHEYDGVKFETVNYGDLILQQTSIEVIHNGQPTPYNFYLRTPIPKLKKILFEDSNKFELLKISGLNLESEFDCDGDQTIAIANLGNLHTQMGIQFVRDENATCDERYNLFTLVEADKTEIIEIAPHCYEVKIANCEILPATEKIMAEMFSKYAKL
jgi:hypothetical protein